jgi:dihydroorotate dehydrogenase electron transfer subunit
MAEFNDISAVVLKNYQITEGHYLLTVRLSATPFDARPGQFVMLKIPSPEVFLRRPFSIYGYKRGVLSVLYKVSGGGTAALASVESGSQVMILGPLGRSFSPLPRHRYVVISGGIGLAGIHFLWSTLKGRGLFFWGCSSEADSALISGLRLEEQSIATMDGSLGCKGNVVELLAQHLPAIKKPFQVFACGPEPMFRALKDLLQPQQPPCQILVEERMACGIGVCFGCVKKTTDTSEPYKRVCKEGPVFDLWQTSL